MANARFTLGPRANKVASKKGQSARSDVCFFSGVGGVGIRSVELV